MTLSQLSEKLSLSRPSVTERLHRLQDKGIIEAFTARVSLAGVGRTILLFIQMSQLRVNPTEFEKFAQTHPMLLECHRVTGTVSHILKAAVTDMHGLQKLVDQLIPYGTVNTSVVLSSPLTFRAVLPEEKES